MIDFWKSIAGMYEVEVTSASVEQSFCAMNEANIPVFRVHATADLSVRFLVRRSDYGKLKKLCESRGDSLRICRRSGLYWTFARAVKRPVLLAGLCLFLFAAAYLPTRVLFVKVDGNETVPDNRILEAAGQCGVGFGASRRQVRSEQVKNELLSCVPELKWAGVNTYGCVAVISVREHPRVEAEEPQYHVSSIVADRDGVVTSCTATRGSLLCMEGQAVKQGQVLISGYTDCGISIQATRAEGEIFAQTRYFLQAVTPLDWDVRGEKKAVSRKISLLVGKNRINLWKDSGIWDATCDRMYQEYYMTLPGGFQLPVALCVETCIQFESLPYAMDEDTVGSDLTEFAKRYLLQQMVAGSIQSSTLRISQENGVSVLEGDYICTEMIGRVQPEQIGEENGKTDGTHH